MQGKKKQLYPLKVIACIMVISGIYFVGRLLAKPVIVDPVYTTELKRPCDVRAAIRMVAFGNVDDVKVKGKVDVERVGEYPVTYVYRGREYHSVFKVCDTTPPKVKAKDIKTDMVYMPSPNEFISSQEDASEVEVSFGKDVDLNKEGDTKVGVVVEDAAHNKTVVQAVLTRIKDTIPPVFEDLDDLHVKQGKEGDYEQGVQVLDDLDPDPVFTFDASKVDNTVPGKYTVIYTGKDRSGNMAKAARTVIVDRDPAYGKKVVYLTFDDGPSPNTAKVLDVLQKYHVRATFFVTGTHPEYNDLIKRAHEEGHTIGLHTYSHDYERVYASSDAYFADLQAVSDMVEGITGEKSDLIRFPGGSSNTVSAHTAPGLMHELVTEVEQRGYHYFDWNADSSDASGRNVSVAKIVANATASHASNIILLMHDTFGKDTTPSALIDIIDHYRQEGYIFLGLTSDSFCGPPQSQQLDVQWKQELKDMENSKLTMESRIKDVWDNPIGHDILAKILLQVGVSPKIITNPIVSSIRLKRLVKPAAKILDEGFWDAFLKLVNSEQDRPQKGDGPITKAWWKEAVFYQIYPRSFCADGLKGITQKLDRLQDLGINALWLSPIYDSPMDDNGYDIRDYQKIAPMFGTMADFDTLLKEVHDRGMKLIMDLVVNHTSDEHAWFQSAVNDPDSPYRNWYFLRQDEGHVPNNWTSFFSGKAWDQYGNNGDWALHLFSRKQPDLNWDEPAVRQAVADMVNSWLDKGVDGFRLDVINYISKDEGLPDGDASVGTLMGFTGIEHYYYGPHLHEYLHELHEAAFAPHHAFSVGETPGLGMEMAKLVTGEERQELDMIFSFDHLETPGHTRFEEYRYDLNYYRDYIIDWTQHYGNNCWMSLFYNNHDNPRMVSKVDPTGEHRRAVAKLLAVMQFTLKGTPFVYQGDEMGLANIDFASMDEIQDVESKGMYKQLLDEGKTEAEAFRIVKAGTRDHARALLPWDGPNEYGQTVDDEIQDVYRRLIALRHQEPTLVYGDMTVLDRRKDRCVYERNFSDAVFVIDCNLGDKPTKAWHADNTWMLVYPDKLEDAKLPPYGARIWKKIQ